MAPRPVIPGAGPREAELPAVELPAVGPPEEARRGVEPLAEAQPAVGSPAGVSLAADLPEGPRAVVSLAADWQEGPRVAVLPAVGWQEALPAVGWQEALPAVGLPAVGWQEALPAVGLPAADSREGPRVVSPGVAFRGALPGASQGAPPERPAVLPEAASRAAPPEVSRAASREGSPVEPPGVGRRAFRDLDRARSGQAYFAISIFAMVSLCTSSGPSARRSVLAWAQALASGKSLDTPAPPWA
jgi:hypothetical protein